MEREFWIVKRRTGEHWGRLRRLIIDPAGARIAYADIARAGSGAVVRVPWRVVEWREDAMIVDLMEGNVRC
jgi:hypothetical protein